MFYHISGLVTRLRQPPSFGGAPVAAFGHGTYSMNQHKRSHTIVCMTIERTSIKNKGWNPLQCTLLTFYHWICSMIP